MKAYKVKALLRFLSREGVKHCRLTPAGDHFAHVLSEGNPCEQTPVITRLFDTTAHYDVSGRWSYHSKP